MNHSPSPNTGAQQRGCESDWRLLAVGVVGVTTFVSYLCEHRCHGCSSCRVDTHTMPPQHHLDASEQGQVSLCKDLPFSVRLHAPWAGHMNRTQ